MPTFGSLFAGIGGIDLGLERAGWECRWQVEWDDFCQRVLAKHWPDVPRYGDITTVDWSGVERVDLLAGGFPCQPVSSAGRQKAQSDARWLWPEFRRAIGALRPGLVLVENVTNLLAVNDGSAFGDVLGDLATLGYDAEWDCIPAAAVGAPHERDRVWIVAHARRGGVQPERRPGEVPGSTGPTQGRTSQRERGGDGAGDGGPAVADADGLRLQGERSSGLSGHIDASRWDDADRRRSALADADGARLEGWPVQPERAGERAARASGVEHAAVTGLPQPTLVSVGRSGQPRPERGSAFDGGPAREGQSQSSVGRVFDGLPRVVDSHRWPARPDQPQHPWEPPRVAVGVPDRTRRLKALGNAVVPQVVEVIGRRLLEAWERAA